MCRRTFLFFVALVGLSSHVMAAAPSSLQPSSNWPRWRGPQENGHITDPRLPVTWSDADIAWKSELPGIGQSSPIIWGNHIFLTSYLEKGAERLVFCVDRRDGKLVWQQSAWKGEPEPAHIMNGWASSTCVTDGEIVVAFFGKGGIHAYTVDGKPLWSKDLGPFAGPWGTAACPILVDDMVVQNCDSDADAYITALDKRTGKEIWRTSRASKTDPTVSFRGWSTPIVVDNGERRELVVNGHEGVRSYDPKTGNELWFSKSVRGRGEPTVTPIGDNCVCVVNGQGGEFYAVRLGGSGDVSDSQVKWHTPRKGGRDCPSPIVVGKFIIVSDMAGIATCYDVADGHEYWKERLTGKHSGSPLAANGLVYFLNEDGLTTVIEPAETLKVVATNTITPASDEEIFRASITPSDGQFLIRSTRVLYCVGKR
jgi:outer membrane protein assembly factor BamB